MKCIKIHPLKEPVEVSVAIPGSKSYTNRALLLSALTGGSVKITNPLVSDDTHAMIACLRELGFRCSFHEDYLEVSGDPTAIEDRPYNLNANLSGTTIRFLLALAAIIPGIKNIRGRGRLNDRPIAHLVEALEQLGATIEYTDKKGYPPVRVTSSQLKSGKVRMHGEISSQFLSALLMVAPRIGQLEIEVEGDQVSRPYIEMTIDAMKRFGIEVKNDGFKHYTVTAGQIYRAEEYVVEGDISSASYFFAIAALTHSTITVKNVNPKTVQADIRFLKILETMGSTVEYGEDSITVQGGGVRAIDVDMEDCPDQAQTLAVLAAFAKGTTVIRGIQSLRIKETERVAAVETELKKMGIRTESTPDTMTIYGGEPQAASVDTYGDHRMAMAFAVAGTKLAGMEINDPDVVSKTFPDFWEALAGIGVDLEYEYGDPNIVLIGMRGGGKSTVAKLLSKKLDKRLADLDDMIEKQEGIKIPEIVEKHGWEYFRDRESEIVQKVATQQGLIISTGGGVINRPENIAALKQNGFLIFLSAPAKVLARRIEGTERPRLTEAASTLEEVEAVLAERKKLYEAAADVTLDTEGSSSDQEVEQVLQKLTQRNIL